MPRTGAAVDLHATRFEQVFQQVRGVFGRLFDGQHQRMRRAVDRQCSANHHTPRARLAVEGQLGLQPGRTRDDIVLDLDFFAPRLDRVRNPSALFLSGIQRQRHRIVIHRKRRNRCSVGPHHVVNFPSGRIALEGKQTVVGDNVSVHLLHAARHNRIRKFGQHFFGRPLVFGLFLKGEPAVGKIRIASPRQHQVAAHPSVGRYVAGRFHRRREGEVRTKRGQRQNGCKKFHVRCRRKIFLRVPSEQYFSGRFIGDQDSPFGFAGILRGENGFHARRKPSHITAFLPRPVRCSARQSAAARALMLGVSLGARFLCLPPARVRRCRDTKSQQQPPNFRISIPQAHAVPSTKRWRKIIIYPSSRAPTNRE